MMPTKPDNGIGSRIRMLRRDRGLTLRRMADQLGINFSVIANWEAGRIRPGHRMVPRLAAYFGVAREWLERGAGAMTPSLTAPAGWPGESLRAQWGSEMPVEPPAGWPPGLVEYVAAAIEFGIQPSTAALARMIIRARELGSAEPLPPELQAALAGPLRGQDDPRGYRWIGFAEWFLRATDAALDAVEEAIRKKD